MVSFLGKFVFEKPKKDFFTKFGSDFCKITLIDNIKDLPEFKVLLKEKFMHYNGKLTQAEMDAKGWSYDPLNGLTVLKGDMDKWYDADPIIQAHQAKMHYTQELVDTLKEILDNIKWRHQSIKNAIEWHKFTSGM